MSEEYSTHKKMMRAIGIPLLIIGIILVIFGFVNFTSGSFGGARSSMFTFAAGGFMLVIGFALINFSLVRPISKYYATEAAPAIKTAGRAIGEGFKEAGMSASQPREIIKVKCPHCGYLETEDAEFCSKCGKSI